MLYKIKQRRMAQQLTQTALAEKSGVSRATISALENGEMKTTTTDTLIKLADALKCTVSDIFLP